MLLRPRIILVFATVLGVAIAFVRHEAHAHAGYYAPSAAQTGEQKPLDASKNLDASLDSRPEIMHAAAANSHRGGLPCCGNACSPGNYMTPGEIFIPVPHEAATLMHPPSSVPLVGRGPSGLRRPPRA